MNALLQILLGQSGTFLEVGYQEMNLAWGGVSGGNPEGSEIKHFDFAHLSLRYSYCTWVRKKLG